MAAHVAPVTPQTPPFLEFRKPKAAEPDLRFELALFEPEGLAKTRAKTVTVSLAAHAVLTALAILIPILTYDILPAPGEGVRAFFVVPLEAAPPPPPPPPPPAGARPQAKAPAPAPLPEDAKFVAPVEIPAEVKPEAGIDVGVEGGVPGGVEGGVPGGVIGGIVGGLPTEAPAPPPVKAVRVGGQIKAPKLLHVVSPVYPDLAAQARLAAIVIAEALVDTSGRVREVKILRGAPLFDDAAVAAVKQWRYQPLLLNGVPTEFILTVTVKFNLNMPER